MVQKSETIWFDGKQVPWDEANVHVLTHTLHYGAGVFEGIRAYECADGSSEVFRLEEHMIRLVNSAKILGIKVPYTVAELCAAATETLKRNKLAGAYLRPLVFIGDGVMGVHPGNNPIRTVIATWPWGAYLGDEALEKGIKIKTSTFARHHVNVMMTKAKACGNYVNSVLAKTEAVADGYHEAVLLDTTGHVSEGSGENIFMVVNDVIYTPHSDGVLGGLTRDSIITLATDLGYEVREEPITRDMLYIADEVFFTGTAAELTPVSSIDRREIGEGKAGPVAKLLQTEYFKIVKGENSDYEHWLHRYTI
ncbi:MAG: branched-chain amino acid transaminase [Pseudodesulfovibrio sp.]|uniref:Branched-chain-amino-acid aminotransferase n=1 Tax=Pseudodesulfovibrio aespoeensis (strain ATCC 700646 / DSM 10631 / Aspo-2) TaxID=643562 RepID=E6VW10_PSEA9|nr:MULTISPECIES: branched-chain amino acid transaminase [Pseudodesulfovibrio]MBU4191484.1 branched-chain amino acid transaminase [Pseudomonadota bacterium]ADU62455.1 branched-chain amino acid aminotransferase [Pseudodesulfovibrio aespoeensis Aspo-2]MBU4244620.1 branched-chain amino acid transaminase [Pseudomonadota bacterium]MBU4377787.1 branched-chain amino acid transaminase [Pseudomonadota bacterium]MBU4476704.1 branched-chain amino acid transaminase [Pseudomonadota bacterium]